MAEIEAVAAPHTEVVGGIVVMAGACCLVGEKCLCERGKRIRKGRHCNSLRAEVGKLG